MDPIQRHTWLREHQLPNQKPSKLMVTETQNLTRNQILTLQNFERPRLFHAQSPNDQTNLQQTATDLQSPPHTLTTTPQIPQPLLSFLEKRNYQDEQSDPNETKKQKSENAPDESATMTLHLNLQHHSSIVQPSLIHPNRKMTLMNNPKQINGRI